MKYSILILIFVISAFNASAQNLLKFEWKFQTGDNTEWANTNFDDSKWPTITAGTNWESQGYSTYDGFAWYRQTIIIPSKLKKDINMTPEFRKKFLEGRDHTGRFIVTSERTGRSYFVEADITFCLHMDQLIVAVYSRTLDLFEIYIIEYQRLAGKCQFFRR